jgi:hypothetical protein
MTPKLSQRNGIKISLLLLTSCVVIRNKTFFFFYSESFSTLTVYLTTRNSKINRVLIHLIYVLCSLFVIRTIILFLPLCHFVQHFDIHKRMRHRQKKNFVIELQFVPSLTKSSAYFVCHCNYRLQQYYIIFSLIVILFCSDAIEKVDIKHSKNAIIWKRICNRCNDMHNLIWMLR